MFGQVHGEVQDKLKEVPATGEFVLYEGPVRRLCPLAPNNVNTMACAAIAGHTLGFDGVVARLVADRAYVAYGFEWKQPMSTCIHPASNVHRLSAHVIEIDVRGKTPSSGLESETFRVTTERINPAVTGEVTGSATYVSFYSSLVLAAATKGGDGVHMC